MFTRLWVLLAALLPLSLAHAQAEGKVTFIDGRVHLIRGVQVLDAVPGLAVSEADMVGTAAGGYVLIEFGDGLRLGLGPDTRLLLRTLNPRGKDSVRELAVLGGWIKVQSALADGIKDYRLLAPGLSLQWREASFIARVGAADTALFVETGVLHASVADGKGRVPAPSEVRGGRFVTHADGVLTTRERPGEPFVVAMPRPFRDPLPPLLSRIGTRVVEPRAVAEVAYADVAPWLQGPKAWRGSFIARFRSRASDAAFHRGLVDNMSAHPEWDRVLFPEKYRPRPPVAAPALTR
ncbi:MAG: FecR domain-containing protein [Azoarcus sp.]|nr:FecR domain-containing protein [Azoarcus sp.]